MKNKYIITFTKLHKDIIGSEITVKVLKKKSFFHKWTEEETVQATCTGFNCWDGFEWRSNGIRMNHIIEWQAIDQAKKMFKKGLTTI
ncbi:hypothetical protein pEaSNUABM44_00537 [Erwinia phage pEa_SNUABM_44]|nr:hypothetical protein pEaSNUABM44_00537 [Erwinia phage pEa_SNUABM_44]